MNVCIDMSAHLVLGILFFCVGLDYAQPTSVNESQWDLLIFTQQWPITVCREWTDHNPSHRCAMPSNEDSWTVHGIWPTKLGTIGPGFCNRSWHFDPEQIKPIEEPLMQLWTNIEADTATYAFWSHEWNKHGTCAATLEPLNSELKYFSKGLEWVQKYSLIDILAEGGITPSNDKEYPITDIHYAIKNKLGVNPAIECRKENGRNWLVELRICFNKTLELTDCDGILRIYPRVISVANMLVPVLTNCDKSQGVIYPYDSKMKLMEPPNRLYVQLYKLVSWLQWFTL